jgi:DNA mismatch repair protein MutS2
MIYPDNFEQKTGFDHIRQLIAAHCLSPMGKEKVADMSFSSDFNAIRKQLYQTAEFMRLLREEDAFPTDYFFDVRTALKKIRIEGTYLIEKELFDIRRSLETIHAMVGFFHNAESYPSLRELASGIASFPRLTGQIDAILDKFGKVRDNASPELAVIRRQLIQTAGSISKTLHSILRAAQSESLVDRDVAPTMRDGRLMIPISPAFKRKIKGIVHDESASGKTVFIEPAEVVEANNKIRELESEEKREIIRILTTFTDRIRPDVPEILKAYLFMADIDFIRAKALFAADVNATLPVIEDVRQMDWIRAVHPLLYLSHKKQGKPVVPLDMELSAKPVILLVSGPNAGGKSVLLKTAGLLQYMLQSGLPIPVDERSGTGIFKDIFLDIGDEQSIENDLSTYSSHLLNMKFMLKQATADSLILIDEFGGGTEPVIGGAIAEALLHRFNDKGCFGVITTHYHNLKLYADSHEGVVNGAMLYDRHLMQPLFQLSVGQPGSSFAIEIARKTGLAEDMIAEASEKAGRDYISMDKYLQDIVRDKRYWETKRRQIRQQEKQMEELSNRYRSDLEKLEAQKKEWLAKAKTDAGKLLAEANALIEKTIREIREAQAEKEKTKELRKGLETFRQRLTNDEQKAKDGTTETKRNGQKAKSEKQKQAASSRLAVGDAVRMKGQQTIGEVVIAKDDFFVAAFGAVKTIVRAEQLEKVQGVPAQTAKQPPAILNPSPASVLPQRNADFKLEIDVRGMRGDEALQTVIYYIDDAIRCNAGRVRILHGTGTGALRQIIREYLKTALGVKHFQDEHVQFGGAGITVVDLE